MVVALAAVIHTVVVVNRGIFIIKTRALVSALAVINIVIIDAILIVTISIVYIFTIAVSETSSCRKKRLIYPVKLSRYSSYRNDMV